MIPTRGVFGSLETPILGQNILFYSPGFTPYFIDFGAGDMLCVFFEVKESIYRSFIKMRLSVLVKMAISCKIKARRRFR